MTSICLCMIVKNEVPVIRRCLESVRPIISRWVIVDTGSSDGTQDAIREYMADLPGELHERPWVDFAYNRSEALELARGKCSYTLIIDADDALDIIADTELPALTADSYTVEIRDTATVYRRPQLVRSALPWRYEGVLHEYLTCEGAGPSGHLTAIRMLRNHDGARRKDPRTYQRDAAVLEAALRTETSPFLISRYRFYLAQSYRDCGEKEKALENYLARAELGFWQQEVFVALYQAARLKEQLAHSDREVIDAYRRAADSLPARAEALHGASRFCRYKSRFEEGYQIAKRGLDIAMPPSDALFVEPWIYEYGMRDEFAVNAYWAERYDDSLNACEQLLRGGKLPEHMRERIEKNADFARDKLAARRQPAPQAPRSSWVPETPAGGTEIMVDGLRARMGRELDRIDLRVNRPGDDVADGRPRVVWIHHDVNQQYMKWCLDKARVDSVDWFVFVSDWQRERYLQTFGLPPERCVVLRNATEAGKSPRHWEAAPVWRCAYTSTPFRGLSVLLDAWQRLGPANAELHIWSSMKLYVMDDGPYRELYERAQTIPGVIYHGVLPNDELRAALRSMHFLTYPSTFEETSCLAVIEAMAAGCRVICPSVGALPETTGQFARLYSFQSDPATHAELFAEVLDNEIHNPWRGNPGLAEQQQIFVHATYNWPVRIAEWRTFIDLACNEKNPPLGVVASIDDVCRAQNIPFNICLVSINEHDRIFDDITSVMASALNELGYACSVQKNAVQDGTVNIVIGSTVFAAKYGALEYLTDQPHIIYQIEQLKSGEGILNENPEYLDILRAGQFIFEYSPAGMEFLQRAGLGEKAIYLPPAFHHTQAAFVPNDDPDIDVFFYGSHSLRRTKLIDDLRRHGVNAVRVFNVYGEALNEYLRRSKIVINIHTLDGVPTLETFRISFLLANRCFVISETSDHNPYGVGVVYADYGSLVAVCLEYLGPKAAQRAIIAGEGYVEYRRSEFVTKLRDALLRVPLKEMLTHCTNTNGSFIMNTPSRIASDPPTYISAKFAAYCKLDQAGGLHTGLPYLEFLKLLAARLNPSSYLEIGTESGISLRQFECDSVCIDPAFQITQDVLLGRKRTFFFQMTSDEFFSQYDVRTFFPRGVDVGFLDGLHHFEALLRDFINFERCCHENSIAILHDCLPTDLVMTSREFRWGGWTGDVWQILPALKRYRPDLRIFLLDCPPTGLVLCCGLDSRSSVLQDRFSEVVDEYSRSVLDEGGLVKLRSMFPLIDTRRLAQVGGGDIGLIIAPTTGHAG